jgi:phage minor structural protein
MELYLNNQDTSKNGLFINAESCKIKVELAGQDELESVVLNSEIDTAVQDKLLKVDTPAGKELYRIYNSIKGMNSTRIYARRKYFDLVHKVVTKNITGTRQEILNTILQGTGYIGKYIGNKANKLTIEGKTNVIEVLSSLEEEYIVHGNVITVGHVGEDKGYVVEFGYNLEDISEDINIDDVVTRIYPCYKDIIGDPVDSKYINNYSIPHEQFIDFEITSEDEEKEYTESEIKSILRDKAVQYYEETSCDKPLCNYDVKALALKRTNEHYNYEILEDVNLGDTVHCKNKQINIICDERCISFEYDCIKKEYDDIELGQPTETYSDRIIKKESETAKLISDTEKGIEEKEEEARNNLKVILEKRDTEIEASVTNEVENRKTAIMVLDGKIEEKVDTEEFSTYKSQTDREFSQKVSKGSEFSSEMRQNINAFQFLFEEASGNKTEITRNGLTIYKGGIEIKDNRGNTVMDIDSNGVMRITAAGIKDLNIYDTSSDSMFYNTLANMDVISCGEIKPNRLTLEDDEFYINSDGWTLKEYVERLINGQHV